MKKLKILSHLMVLPFLLFLTLPSCRPPKNTEENAFQNSKSFNAPYDVVWNALETILTDELRYPIQFKNKEKGVIETDWISVIRLRGTLRWNMRIFLNRKGNETVVSIRHRVERPSEVRGKMKDKSGNINRGWQSSNEDIEDVGILLQMLSSTLEKQPSTINYTN